MFEKPSGWIVSGVLCLAVSLLTLWIAIDAFGRADERGMVVVKSRSIRRGEYPAPFFCLVLLSLQSVRGYAFIWLGRLPKNRFRIGNIIASDIGTTR